MKKVLVTLIIGLMIAMVAYGQPDPNEIKLPEGAEMPTQLKCPVHGILGKAFIVIDTDDGRKAYCTKCAKSFVARVFDLNLPKLEVVK